MTNQNLQDLVIARNRFEESVRRGTGVKAFRETFKNVLFNNYADLMEAAKGEAGKVAQAELDKANRKIELMQEQIDELNQELIESDKENNELRKELRQLKGHPVNGESDA